LQLQQHAADARKEGFIVYIPHGIHDFRSAHLKFEAATRRCLLDLPGCRPWHVCRWRWFYVLPLLCHLDLSALEQLDGNLLWLFTLVTNASSLQHITPYVGSPFCSKRA
jgi:hypothetical protein